ncbi:hypothetical protein NGTWS0302_24160 [Mycolicibacterium cyprinidarum]|uniref:Uncharacterized protein n=1 Tax=Mycolicibacterium cyprinidarum TaxID=2860311 RepID=A0ABQ4VBE9_9MYCO|nr:hypothetical protein NGTWS0302_24160 [Mycolicibacterium sp. NGTWS0302]GJF17116.1 hypothetical protein NGTWS1702_23050 [Mycolicibacterium sp. NGTWSNA01]
MSRRTAQRATATSTGATEFFERDPYATITLGKVSAEVLRLSYWDPNRTEGVGVDYEVHINGQPETCGLAAVVAERLEALINLAVVCSHAAARLAEAGRSNGAMLCATQFHRSTSNTKYATNHAMTPATPPPTSIAIHRSHHFVASRTLKMSTPSPAPKAPTTPKIAYTTQLGTVDFSALARRSPAITMSVTVSSVVPRRYSLLAYIPRTAPIRTETSKRITRSVILGGGPNSIRTQRKDSAESAVAAFGFASSNWRPSIRLVPNHGERILR